MNSRDLLVLVFLLCALRNRVRAGRKLSEPEWVLPVASRPSKNKPQQHGTDRRARGRGHTPTVSLAEFLLAANRSISHNSSSQNMRTHWSQQQTRNSEQPQQQSQQQQQTKPPTPPEQRRRRPTFREADGRWVEEQNRIPRFSANGKADFRAFGSGNSFEALSCNGDENVDSVDLRGNDNDTSDVQSR